MPAFRMKPALKEYLWGGRRLKEEWGVQAAADTVAEAWVLSAHPDGESIVAEGEFAGKTLRELLSALGSAACGTHASSDIFPVLIKLIDARDRLSIQVHPDETYAMAHEGQHGKTECWVILDAAPGAFLYYGFSREVSREEFEDRIRTNTLTEVLNAVEVHRGDVLTIPPGTL
ncbi:MAG: class I mannose-6-phosphate isomerase, partial [Lachnospiraceae bacterium]|nr:class I mannose-6-phosphate isomerase [Lachnospiraceae bacterium]